MEKVENKVLQIVMRESEVGEPITGPVRTDIIDLVKKNTTKTEIPSGSPHMDTDLVSKYLKEIRGL